jgi:hypothetical protein
MLIIVISNHSHFLPDMLNDNKKDKTKVDLASPMYQRPP